MTQHDNVNMEALGNVTVFLKAMDEKLSSLEQREMHFNAKLMQGSPMNSTVVLGNVWQEISEVRRLFKSIQLFIINTMNNMMKNGNNNDRSNDRSNGRNNDKMKNENDRLLQTAIHGKKNNDLPQIPVTADSPSVSTTSGNSNTNSNNSNSNSSKAFERKLTELKLSDLENMMDDIERESTPAATPNNRNKNETNNNNNNNNNIASNNNLTNPNLNPKNQSHIHSSLSPPMDPKRIAHTNGTKNSSINNGNNTNNSSVNNFNNTNNNDSNNNNNNNSNNFTSRHSNHNSNNSGNGTHSGNQSSSVYQMMMQNDKPTYYRDMSIMSQLSQATNDTMDGKHSISHSNSNNHNHNGMFFERLNGNDALYTILSYVNDKDVITLNKVNQELYQITRKPMVYRNRTLRLCFDKICFIIRNNINISYYNECKRMSLVSGNTFANYEELMSIYANNANEGIMWTIPEIYFKKWFDNIQQEWFQKLCVLSIEQLYVSHSGYLLFMAIPWKDWLKKWSHLIKTNNDNDNDKNKNNNNNNDNNNSLPTTNIQSHFSHPDNTIHTLANVSSIMQQKNKEEQENDNNNNNDRMGQRAQSYPIGKKGKKKPQLKLSNLIFGSLDGCRYGDKRPPTRWFKEWFDNNSKFLRENVKLTRFHDSTPILNAIDERRVIQNGMIDHNRAMAPYYGDITQKLQQNYQEITLGSEVTIESQTQFQKIFHPNLKRLRLLKPLRLQKSLSFYVERMKYQSCVESLYLVSEFDNEHVGSMVSSNRLNRHIRSHTRDLELQIPFILKNESLTEGYADKLFNFNDNLTSFHWKLRIGYNSELYCNYINEKILKNIVMNKWTKLKHVTIEFELNFKECEIWKLLKLVDNHGSNNSNNNNNNNNNTRNSWSSSGAPNSSPLAMVAANSNSVSQISQESEYAIDGTKLPSTRQSHHHGFECSWISQMISFIVKHFHKIYTKFETFEWIVTMVNDANYYSFNDHQPIIIDGRKYPNDNNSNPQSFKLNLSNIEPKLKEIQNILKNKLIMGSRDRTQFGGTVNNGVVVSTSSSSSSMSGLQFPAVSLVNEDMGGWERRDCALLANVKVVNRMAGDIAFETKNDEMEDDNGIDYLAFGNNQSLVGKPLSPLSPPISAQNTFNTHTNAHGNAHSNNTNSNNGHRFNANNTNNSYGNHNSNHLYSSHIHIENNNNIGNNNQSNNTNNNRNRLLTSQNQSSGNRSTSNVEKYETAL